MYSRYGLSCVIDLHTCLKSMSECITKICKEFRKVVLGGDLNIDHCQDNDPLSRPELRALFPLWEQCLLENDLCQINKKNTWHRAGKRSSLLDLFFGSVPGLI